MDCMELKVFGANGPPDEFANDFKALLALDSSAWEIVGKWFLTTDSFDTEEAISSPAIATSPLLPEQFRQCARALQYLLESWHASALQLADLQRDLLVLGVATQDIDRLGLLLERLGPVRQRAYTHFMRFEHENAVLPTLEDIDVVCDVRPIFEDYVYPIPERNTVSHTKLLGFSYLVLMELLTEDFDGNTHRLSFQMTEGTLADFRVALQRATEQLDILKANTRALSTEHQ
jgi:hypothetical protein